MADGTPISPASAGGDTIFDEDGVPSTGQKMPASKIYLGAHGVSDGPVSFTNPLPIGTGDSAAVDAFGRFRTSRPVTLFDSTLVETNGAVFWDIATAGGGSSTYLPNEASMQLSCTTANGDSAVRQTKQYFGYQPGKSMQILLTANMGAIKANVTQRLGYFDTQNGIFWEQDGANLKVGLRTFVTGVAVTTYVNRSAWNIDKFDGSGPSKVTIDMTKIQIFVIDFQWLGAGRVRMGFNVGGITYYCHEFFAANFNTTVYMSRGTLPCRFEIFNTGVAASGTSMKTFCASVQSEGGYNIHGVYRSADTGATSIAVSNAFIPLISIRLMAAHIRAALIPNLLSMWITNNSDVHWHAILGATLTGANFQPVSSNGISEYDVAATAFSGGEVIASGYANGSSPLTAVLSVLRPLGSNIAGVADILTIAAERVDTNNATVCAAVQYQEVF